jgi:hypothetical protein
MKLNWFGRLAMNSPARAAAQRRYTAERMMRLGGDLRGEHALEDAIAPRFWSATRRLHNSAVWYRRPKMIGSVLDREGSRSEDRFRRYRLQ